MSRLVTKPTKWLYAQWRLRSAWADWAPSLIRVFTVHMKKAWVLSYPLSAQRWLWSYWADAQADLSLRWAHSHFVGFVMSWLIYCKSCSSFLQHFNTYNLLWSIKISKPDLFCRFWCLSNVIFILTDLTYSITYNTTISDTSQENMSSVVSDQVRLKPACSATEISWTLEI